MKKSLMLWLIFAFPLLGWVRPAISQYLYLDSNGDGRSTAEDRLSATQPTVVAVYLDTNHDRDGSQQSCNSHTASRTDGAALSIFSYSIVLQVQPGTGSVSWSQYADSVGFEVLGPDESNSSCYLAERSSGGSSLPAGSYKLGVVTVTVTSGAPVIGVAPSSPLDPAVVTAFGTECEGSGAANSYVLGSDWFDADGLGAPTGGGIGAVTTLIAAGPGKIILAGNLLEGPYTLSLDGPRLSVNGLYLPAVATVQEPANLTPDQRAEVDFLGTAEALCDSLRNSDLDLAVATERLATFCRSSSLVRKVWTTLGQVQVRLASGMPVVLSLQKPNSEQTKDSPSPQQVQTRRLRHIQKMVESGYLVFIVSQDVQHIIPRNKVARTLRSVAKLKSGLSLSKEDEPLPKVVQAQLQRPIDLTRVK